jgi:hypothetical protein
MSPSTFHPLSDPSFDAGVYGSSVSGHQIEYVLALRVLRRR